MSLTELSEAVLWLSISVNMLFLLYLPIKTRELWTQPHTSTRFYLLYYFKIVRDSLLPRCGHNEYPLNKIDYRAYSCRHPNCIVGTTLPARPYQGSILCIDLSFCPRCYLSKSSFLPRTPGIPHYKFRSRHCVSHRVHSLRHGYTDNPTYRADTMGCITITSADSMRREHLAPHPRML